MIWTAILQMGRYRYVERANPGTGMRRFMYGKRSIPRFLCDLRVRC